MRCGIIIINYNTYHQVADCLTSLSDAIIPNMDHVVVVDNNSHDNSCNQLTKLIKQNNWQWASLLPQKKNLGFAAGNNAGILYFNERKINPSFLFLLNPDTIVHKSAIQRLVDFLHNHEDTGIVGAQLYNTSGEAESSARRFPSILSEFEAGIRLGIISDLLKEWRVPIPVRLQAHPCDWVSGAAMMIRREVVEEIGLMDAGFFLYFEEVDYCRRAKNKGWEIWLEPGSRITHLEGAATGIRKPKQRRGQYWYASRRRYFIKHLGIIRWILADILWAMGRWIMLLKNIAVRDCNNSNDPHYFMRDLLGGDMRALLSGEAMRIRKELDSHIAKY